LPPPLPIPRDNTPHKKHRVNMRAPPRLYFRQTINWLNIYLSDILFANETSQKFTKLKVESNNPASFSFASLQL